MSKRVIKTAAVLALVLCFLGFFTETRGVRAAEEYTISCEKTVLKPGGKLKLEITRDGVTLTGQGNDLKLTWDSSDEEVAVVSKNGKVTAVAEGKAVITATVTYTDPESETAKTKKLKCKVTVEEEKVVTLAAVGDALIHENILKSGQKKDGTYNYDHLFENMTDYLEKFDVKVINQETIFINDSKKFAGYPSFGTPVEVGDAMRKAGFNVVTCATNHAYDRGAQGIKDTLAYWKNYKDSVLVTGIYGSQKDYDTIAIREFNGIKIAFLNYTTLLNSGAKREPYYIKYYKEAEAVKEIKEAKKKADFVIVFPHWGIEYEHKQSEAQEKMAKKLADAGADAIIGCHPHVVQPMKVIKTSDGRRVPCYYSLGNYVSNMFWFKCQLEGLAELEIVKWNGETTLRSAEYTPIVNHINKDDMDFTVYLLSDYNGDQYKTHYMNTHYWMGNVTYDRLKNLFKSLGNDKY